MPRLCTICTHPERQSIDVALLTHEGASLSSLLWK